jgi:hypothetical protein
MMLLIKVNIPRTILDRRRVVSPRRVLGPKSESRNCAGKDCKLAPRAKILVDAH